MAEGKQVLIKLITKLPDELRVPETPIAVPATIKRLGLSQIVNHLLASDPPKPFDFIINGELLRKPLEAHLLQHGLSAESLLEVEYVPAVVPPEVSQTAPHNDWVSSVDGVLGPSCVVSASYDGRVRTWNITGSSAECVGDWAAHEGPINRVACDSTGSTQDPASSFYLYTAGKDHAVKMWQVSQGGLEPQLLVSFSGHTDAVECVSVSPNGKLIATCGWDGQLLTWQAGQQVADAAHEAGVPAPAKRRKGSKQGTASQPATDTAYTQTTPLSALQGQGHTQCVSCCVWAGEGTLWSGSWDHAVRRWDIETGINTDTYNGSKAVCSVACPGKGEDHIVALGCSDKVLRVYDARTSTSQESLAVRNYPAHAGWVVGLAWHPTSPYQLASASHDHTVKIWDTRSNVPLATLASHTDKTLCVAWVGEAGLVSGGADCKLLSYSTGQHITVTP